MQYLLSLFFYNYFLHGNEIVLEPKVVRTTKGFPRFTEGFQKSSYVFYRCSVQDLTHNPEVRLGAKSDSTPKIAEFIDDLSTGVQANW